MTMHVQQTLLFPWQGGRKCSLQLLIQPWICVPGTHYGWVDRGSVEYEAYPSPLHMANTGNRTPDLLMLSPMPYPLGDMFPCTPRAITSHVKHFHLPPKQVRQNPNFTNIGQFADPAVTVKHDICSIHKQTANNIFFNANGLIWWLSGLEGFKAMIYFLFVIYTSWVQTQVRSDSCVARPSQIETIKHWYTYHLDWANNFIYFCLGFLLNLRMTAKVQYLPAHEYRDSVCTIRHKNTNGVIQAFANLHIWFRKIHINEVSGIIRIKCLVMFFYLPGNVVFREFKVTEESVELFPFSESLLTTVETWKPYRWKHWDWHKMFWRDPEVHAVGGHRG